MKFVVCFIVFVMCVLLCWLLFMFCFVYVVFGLFGCDLWKNEDVVGFGVMWMMVKGGWYDWLLLNLVGKFIMIDGLFGYWFGVLLICGFGLWVDVSNVLCVVIGVLFCVVCVFVWYVVYLFGWCVEV